MKQPTEAAAPLTPDQLKAVNLMIAMPTYQGVVHSGCMLSLFKLSHELRSRSIQQQLRMLDGEMVARARNRLLADFLESNATHMLFVDSDISFDPQAVIRMLQANLGVIGGIYPKKMFRWQGMFSHARSADGKPETLAESGLSYVVTPVAGGKSSVLRDCAEVAEVGTGFLLLQRRVVEAMVKRYKKLSYADDCPEKPRRIPCLFDYKTVNDRYLSEDYFFCHLWRKMGGKVWASLVCPLTHAGTYQFQGDFGRRVKGLKTARVVGPVTPTGELSETQFHQQEDSHHGKHPKT